MGPVSGPHLREYGAHFPDSRRYGYAGDVFRDRMDRPDLSGSCAAHRRKIRNREPYDEPPTRMAAEPEGFQGGCERFGQFVGGYHRKTGAVFPRTGLFDPQQQSLGFRGYPGVRDRGRLFGVSGASRARRHPFLRQGRAECYQP